MKRTCSQLSSIPGRKENNCLDKKTNGHGRETLSENKPKEKFGLVELSTCKIQIVFVGFLLRKIKYNEEVVAKDFK